MSKQSKRKLRASGIGAAKPTEFEPARPRAGGLVSPALRQARSRNYSKRSASMGSSEAAR